MPSKPVFTTTRATNVLTRILIERGLSLDDIRKRLNAPEINTNIVDQAIELGAHVRLWRLAIEVTGDPALGLRLFKYYDQDEMHYVAQLLKYSPDLRASILDWARYVRLICPADRIELRSEGSFYAIVYSNLSPAHQNRFITEHYFSIGLQRTRLRSRKSLSPVELHLSFPDPGYAQEYRNIFNITPTFRKDENAIIFRQKDLEEPQSTANDYLHNHLRKYADLMLEKTILPETVSQRVREILVRLLPRGLAGKEEVAAHLEMGARTLLRKLKEEGHTYREVLDETRKSMALTYLEQGYGLTEIAYLVGFTEPGSFAAAFKTWFGESPGKVRRDLRKEKARDDEDKQNLD